VIQAQQVPKAQKAIQGQPEALQDPKGRKASKGHRVLTVSQEILGVLQGQQALKVRRVTRVTLAQQVHPVLLEQLRFPPRGTSLKV
jgi:hypothetical protein